MGGMEVAPSGAGDVGLEPGTFVECDHRGRILGDGRPRPGVRLGEWIAYRPGDDEVWRVGHVPTGLRLNVESDRDFCTFVVRSLHADLPEWRQGEGGGGVAVVQEAVIRARARWRGESSVVTRTGTVGRISWGASIGPVVAMATEAAVLGGAAFLRCEGDPWGVRFGEWIAFAGPAPSLERGEWGLAHGPTEFVFGWKGSEETARHVAQLLSERLPTWDWRADGNKARDEWRAVERDVLEAAADRIAGRAELLPVEFVPLTKGTKEPCGEPRRALGMGEWCAYRVSDGSDDGLGELWTIAHLPAGAKSSFIGPRAAAVALVRELHARIPTWTPGEPFTDEYERAREAAFATLPEVEARPFVVEVVQRTHLVIMASTLADAQRAAGRLPDSFLESFLQRRDHVAAGVDATDDDGNGAHYAASEADIYIASAGPGRAVVGEGALLYAVDGRVYDPMRAPARVFLRPRPDGDHAHNCPANRYPPTGVQRGPCACLVRAYPQKPASAPAVE